MKHGWNSWDGYLAVHEKVLKFYSRFMENSKTYSVQRVTDRYRILRCENIILNSYSGTRLRVDLKKQVLIETRHGRLMARTYPVNPLISVRD